MWWLFGHKKRVDDLQKEVQDSFNHVKNDFNKVGEWIKHLDDKHTFHKDEVSEVREQLLSLQQDVLEIKELVSFFNPQLSNEASKHNQMMEHKQTTSDFVQTPVQSPVQTDILSNLTVMERGIVWTLLNSDMRLSYEDIAALLGKNKSTIRGQINAIKQKNRGLIVESRELSGKKRLYIPEEMRDSVMKSVKVKVNASKKDKSRKSES